MLPKSVSLASGSTVDPALAVPENKGVLSLVILSTFEAPLSEEEPRSGANGLDLFG